MSKPIKYKIALLTRGNPGLQRMRFLDALFYKEVFKNWNDYKIFKKDQKILNPGGDFFASEINFIEPCGYKQDENKKPEYEKWVCTWCGGKNKWSDSLCECEVLELERGKEKLSIDWNKYKKNYEDISYIDWIKKIRIPSIYRKMSDTFQMESKKELTDEERESFRY